MEERATAYMALFYRSMQIEGVFPDNQTVRVIFLRHTDAQWKDDLSDLPEVCRQESPPLDSPTAVVERIAEIPTRFKLASECDRQLAHDGRRQGGRTEQTGNRGFPGWPPDAGRHHTLRPSTPRCPDLLGG